MEKDGRINDYSDTALTLACKKSFNDGQMNYCFAVELVEGGCNINLSDLNGVTPLMLICQMSDETDFQVSLLEAGADLDAVDKNGNTPLHYTARNKSYNIRRRNGGDAV